MKKITAIFLAAVTSVTLSGCFKEEKKPPKFSMRDLQSFVQDFEKCSLTAYKDTRGYAIGWGHTGKNVKQGQKITQRLADAWLTKDLLHYRALVDSAVTVDLNGNEMEALTSFAFNIGPGCKGKKDGFRILKNGQQPTFLKKLNAGDKAGAMEAMLKWEYGGGEKLGGLTIRRQAEKDLFFSMD